MKKNRFNKYLLAVIAVGAIAITVLGLNNRLNFAANSLSGLIGLSAGAPSRNAGGAPTFSPPGGDGTGSSTVPVSSSTDATTTTNISTETLSATLMVNGQSTLTLQSTPYSKGPYVPDQVGVELAWSTNISAKCTANENYPGSQMLGWYGDLPSSSGKKTVYVHTTGNNQWTLYLKCTRQDKTINAEAKIIVGSGNNGNGEVHLKDVAPVKLTGNNQSRTITVNPGDNVLLQWNASDYGTADCTASGDWGGRKATPNGQEFTGPLYTNKSYTITCLHATEVYESTQQKTSDTMTVYVSKSAAGSSSNTTTTPPCVIPNDGRLHLPCPGPTPAPAPAPTPSPQPQPSPTPSTIKIPPAGFEDEVVTTDTTANPFTDTNMASLQGKAAAELYRRGVLGGYADGEFKGGLEVNRAQAAKFLLLAKLQTVEELENSGKFSDVVDGQWYVKFVVKAANLGIIKGYSDGSFRPENSVKTAEFLKMFSKTFGLQENLNYTYTDVHSSDWFAAYAGIAQKYNLFPEGGKLLKPDHNLTRDEVAVAIYQYLKNR